MGSVGLPADDLCPGCHGLGEGDKSVPLERQDQIRKHVPRHQRRKGPGRVSRLAIGDQCAPGRHGGAHEGASGIRLGDQAALDNRKDGRFADLKLFRFTQRMGDDHALPRVCQRLGESLEQGGIPAGEKDHGLSLGRSEEPVKGRERLGVHFKDLVS